MTQPDVPARHGPGESPATAVAGPGGVPPASEFGAAHRRPGRYGGYDFDDDPDVPGEARFTDLGWSTG